MHLTFSVFCCENTFFQASKRRLEKSEYRRCMKEQRRSINGMSVIFTLGSVMAVATSATYFDKFSPSKSFKSDSLELSVKFRQRKEGYEVQQHTIFFTNAVFFLRVESFLEKNRSSGQLLTAALFSLNKSDFIVSFSATSDMQSERIFCRD